MDPSRRSSTPSVLSRPKRSQTNLADLRLAPLSAKYAERSQEPSSPPEDRANAAFQRSHSSYLQGRSVPTTPGILSRNSSGKHLLRGLSRRSSLYDNEPQQLINYEYAGVVREDSGEVRVEVGSRPIPKAKSEAALLVQRSKRAAQGRPIGAHRYQRRSRPGTGGTNTPRARTKLKAAEDDWLTRTGAAAIAIIQESKGVSWLDSRPSATSLTHLQDTTDEEDEGYEEMAALSASTRRRQRADGELSPVNSRSNPWGSRYGSRTGSRRTSRRGSFNAGSRTALAPLTGRDGAAEYLDQNALLGIEPDFVDPEEETDSQDEDAVAQFTAHRGKGFGGIMDRLMNFSLFKVEEREESTEDEAQSGAETSEVAAARRVAEKERKRKEKEELVERQTAAEGRGEGQAEGEGGWSDAAWLLSVASKALF
ncbi:hypothetical protein LTR37_012575 [Vermiconidia calcicola]|uniref:Uncharacterized protein n=1 Tax=Vermiconidia calcicola TaxID=1690605 RepID=A0ACC3N0J5_9PEZI|nr:hypothetical protein LTR37_012575 [Vermiconidia calcicola]